MQQYSEVAASSYGIFRLGHLYEPIYTEIPPEEYSMDDQVLTGEPLEDAVE